MITSEVAVYNLALNAMGGRNNVSSPSENSREAEVCRLWFTVVRDQILSAASWPEATAIVQLAQLSSGGAVTPDYNNTNFPPGAPYADGFIEDLFDLAQVNYTPGGPTPGYGYVYALPNDCIQPQYLLNYDRFKVTGYADDQEVLITNSSPAVLAYTKQLITISAWSSPLQMAIVYGLAAHICMPLSGKPSRGRELLQMANQYVMNARENAANVSNEVMQSIPDWLIARGYFDSSFNTRFVYPLGQLLTVPLNVL